MRALALLVAAGCAAPAPVAEQPRPASVPTVVVENGVPPPVLLEVSGNLCWLLSRDRGRDPDGKDYDRTTLCLYRANEDPRAGFDLVAVREVSFDQRMAEYRTGKPHVKEVWEAMKREEARRK